MKEWNVFTLNRLRFPIEKGYPCYSFWFFVLWSWSFHVLFCYLFYLFSVFVFVCVYVNRQISYVFIKIRTFCLYTFNSTIFLVHSNCWLTELLLNSNLSFPFICLKGMIMIIPNRWSSNYINTVLLWCRLGLSKKYTKE